VVINSPDRFGVLVVQTLSVFQHSKARKNRREFLPAGFFEMQLSAAAI
jgi:hypothetical protein